MTPVYYPVNNRFALAVDHVFTFDGWEVWIPAGYRWNGASIPQALWSFLGGRYEPWGMQAGLEHDWNYLTHALTRKAADELFHRRLLEAGMPRLKAYAMYQAVRAFGAGAWRTTPEAQKEIAGIREMIAHRHDADRFTRMMLVQ